MFWDILRTLTLKNGKKNFSPSQSFLYEEAKRGANFTKSEIDILIDIVLKYKNIIENKKTDSTSWKEKNEVWETISSEFNATSGNFARSTKTIRAKYESIKKNICKKCSLIKSEQMKTGGGSCQWALTPAEEKIVSLAPNTMLGLPPRRYDKDYLSTETGPRTSDDCLIVIVDEPGPSTTNDNDIQIVDENDYEFLQYLRDAENLATSLAPTIDDPPASTPSKKRKIDQVECLKEPKTRQRTDSRFIFKNKRAKINREKNDVLQENVKLKNEILQLQRNLLEKEIEEKSRISALTIENLELDAEIKKLTLTKLRMDLTC